MAMKVSNITALALVLGLLATPVAAQKGVGDTTGVARQAVKPATQLMAGTITDIKIGPCERTTGRSLEGVHLIVRGQDGAPINLHLGPTAALEDMLDQLSAGQQITFEGFRTSAMPQDAYVAKSIQAGETRFDLRDNNLRPKWAIATRGGRGSGAGQGAGRGQPQGRAFRPGSGACYW